MTSLKAVFDLQVKKVRGKAYGVPNARNELEKAVGALDLSKGASKLVSALTAALKRALDRAPTDEETRAFEELESATGKQFSRLSMAEEAWLTVCHLDLYHTKKEISDACVQIRKEAAARKKALAAMDKKLEQEVLARQLAENLLSKGLQQEVLARQQAEERLNAEVKACGESIDAKALAIQEDLEREVQARKVAENDMQEKLRLEVLARQQAEKKRAELDNKVQTCGESLDAQARSMENLEREVQARKVAQEATDEKLEQEVLARQQAEKKRAELDNKVKSLGESIDAKVLAMQEELQREVQARKLTEKAMQEKATQEALARQQAEQKWKAGMEDMQKKLQQEVLARQQAEQKLTELDNKALRVKNQIEELTKLLKGSAPPAPGLAPVAGRVQRVARVESDLWKVTEAEERILQATAAGQGLLAAFADAARCGLDHEQAKLHALLAAVHEQETLLEGQPNTDGAADIRKFLRRIKTWVFGVHQKPHAEPAPQDRTAANGGVLTERGAQVQNRPNTTRLIVPKFIRAGGDEVPQTSHGRTGAPQASTQDRVDQENLPEPA